MSNIFRVIFIEKYCVVNEKRWLMTEAQRATLKPERASLILDREIQTR